MNKTALLYRIAKSFAAVRDGRELLRVIFAEVQPVFGFYDIGLSVLDQSGTFYLEWASYYRELSPSKTNDALYRDQNFTYPVDEPLMVYGIERCRSEGKPLLVNFDEEFIARFKDFPHLATEVEHGFRQSLVTTLEFGGATLGLLNFNAQQANHFAHCDLALFQAVADLIAAAVANILAKEEILEREREKATLLSISEDIAAARNAVELLQVIRDKAQRLIPFYDTGILIVEPDGQHHYDLAVNLSGWDNSESNQKLQELQLNRIPHRGSYVEAVMQKLEAANSPIIEDFETAYKEYDYPFFDVMKELKLKESIVATLKSGGKTFGTLWLNSLEKNHFHPKQFEIFQALADQVAVAVANILANEEILAREREKATLLSISEDISTIRDKDDLFQVITEKIKPIFGFDDAVVFVADCEKNTYYLLLANTPPNRLASEFYAPLAVASLPLKDSIEEWIVSHDRPFIFSAAQFAERFPAAPGVRLMQEVGIKDGMLGTLRNGGKIIGSFHLHSERENFFQPPQLALFQSVTEQLAVAVSNILANEEILAREREKTMLLSISGDVATIRERKDLFDVINSKVKSIFGFDEMGIYVIDPDRQHYRLLYDDYPADEATNQTVRQMTQGLPMQHSRIAEVVFADRPAFLLTREEMTATAPEAGANYVAVTGIENVICAPLKVGGQVIGCFNISTRQKNFFTEALLPLYQSVADQLAVAVANILANEEILEREREKALLLSLSEDMATIRDRDDLWRVMMEKVKQIAAFDDAVLLTLNKDLSGYDFVLTMSPEERRAHRLYAKVVGNNRVANSPVEWYLAQPSDFIVQDLPALAANPTFPSDDPAVKMMLETGLTYSLIYKLRWAESFVGLLFFHFQSNERILAAKHNLYKSIADQIAVAVANILANEEIAQLAEERRLRAEQLANANAALRHTADELVKAATIDDTLAVFLNQAMQIAGAPAGAVLRRIAGTQFEFVVLRDGDRVTTGEALRQLPFSAALPAISERDPVGYFARLVNGETMQWSLAELAVWYPEAHDWEAERDHRTAWDIPFVVQGEVAGYLGLIFQDERKPDDATRENIVALSNQMAVAFELTRLAEQAKQTAVALEREQAAQERAAELGKANEALRRSIAGLASIDSLDEFLAEMLLAALDVTGAQNGAVVLVRDKFAEHIVLIEGGRRVTRAEQERERTYRVPILPELLAYIEQTHNSGDVWAPPPDEISHTPSFVDYHRSRGNQAIRNVPMCVNGEIVGWLGLGFAEPEPPVGRQIDLLRVLAEQMTVAVELSRLAEQAKQAAVAREQEKAAQERSTRLAKANEALQRTVSKLTEQSQLDVFLSHVLTEISAAVGSRSAALFVHDAPADSLTMRAFIHQGQVLDIAADQRMEIWRQPVALNEQTRPGWESIRRHPHFQSPFTGELPGDEMAWKFADPFHQMMGHRAVLSVLLKAGENDLGFLGLGFAEPPQMAVEQLSLAQALTHQAALAIQLTNLSDEARRKAEHSATLAERNRIAREIHDTLAQGFTGVVVQLNAADRIFGDAPEEAHAHLRRAIDLAREGLNEARRSVRALRPGSLEEGDLPSALRRMVETVTAGTNLTAEFRTSGTPHTLDANASADLLRLGQEAVTNVLRHAHADKLQVEFVWLDNACVRLRVLDNGRGFEVDTAQDGFGLVGMRERAARLGGTLDVYSGPGLGTEVVFETCPEAARANGSRLWRRIEV